MPIEVVLQDEFGQPEGPFEVGDVMVDGKLLLPQLLPELEDESYCCLRFVDFWGDTTFNGLQMRALIPELDRLIAATSLPEAHQLLQNIRELAERCRDEIHLYPRFIGD